MLQFLNLNFITFHLRLKLNGHFFFYFLHNQKIIICRFSFSYFFLQLYLNLIKSTLQQINFILFPQNLLLQPNPSLLLLPIQLIKLLTKDSQLHFILSINPNILSQLILTLLQTILTHLPQSNFMINLFLLSMH